VDELAQAEKELDDHMKAQEDEQSDFEDVMDRPEKVPKKIRKPASATVVKPQLTTVAARNTRGAAQPQGYSSDDDSEPLVTLAAATRQPPLPAKRQPPLHAKKQAPLPANMQ
jgi:hypothetical protein